MSSIHNDLSGCRSPAMAAAVTPASMSKAAAAVKSVGGAPALEPPPAKVVVPSAMPVPEHIGIGAPAITVKARAIIGVVIRTIIADADAAATRQDCQNQKAGPQPSGATRRAPVHHQSWPARAQPIQGAPEPLFAAGRPRTDADFAHTSPR